MAEPPEFNLNDLVSSDKLEQSLQIQIKQAVETGNIAPGLCLELARICREKGKSPRAVWFAAVSLITPQELGKKHLNMVIETLIKSIEDTGKAAPDADFQRSLEFFFLTLDYLSSRANENFLQSMVHALVLSQPAAKIFCAGELETKILSASHSFLSVILAILASQGLLKEADAIARRLEQLPKIGRYAYRALARLYIFHGKYDQAKQVLVSAIDKTEEDYQIFCEHAALSYCLGEEEEARRLLARARDFISGGFAEKHQAEISGWKEKLKEAIDQKLTDGGAFQQIGASINYTRPDMAAKVWCEHQVSCVEEKQFSSISAYTNKVMYGYVEKLLSEEGGPSKVVNYGVSCGILEYGMASLNADVFFAGYDISETATELNKENYSKDNLAFGSDLLPLLAEVQKTEGKSLLIHCRTMDIMFPEAVKNVYRACHESGIDLILSAEYFSLSFDTLNYPDFTKNPVDTVHWDGILVMHNFDKIFPETGYRIIDREFVPFPLFVSVTGEGRHSSMLIQLVLAERVAG